MEGDTRRMSRFWCPTSKLCPATTRSRAGCTRVGVVRALPSPRDMIYHITLTARERVSFAHDDTQRRELVRALAGTFLERMLLFCVVPAQVQIVVDTDGPGMVAESLRRLIRSRWTVLDLEPAHVKEVDNRRYLLW